MRKSKNDSRKKNPTEFRTNLVGRERFDLMKWVDANSTGGLFNFNCLDKARIAFRKNHQKTSITNANLRGVIKALNIVFKGTRQESVGRVGRPVTTNIAATKKNTSRIVQLEREVHAMTTFLDFFSPNWREEMAGK